MVFLVNSGFHVFESKKVVRSVAYDFCARMAYGGQSLEAAAQEVMMKSLATIGGRGGLIALDALGHLSCPLNTGGLSPQIRITRR